MFATHQRLSRPEFETCFTSGRRYHGEVATVIFCPSPTLKVSAVVGKKVSKSAVTRNLLRRRVYAQLRDYLFDSHTGTYICILKPGAKDLNKSALHETLKSILHKVVTSQNQPSTHV